MGLLEILLRSRTLQRSFAIVLSFSLIFLFQNAVGQGTPQCQCQVSVYFRRSCASVSIRAGQQTCENAGCCYDSQFYNLFFGTYAPRCFEATGDCPISECQIPTSSRQSCGNYYRYACQRIGCCYDNTRQPNCFQSTRATTTVAPTPSINLYLWSRWTGWSACSTSCGSGIRRKARSCIYRPTAVQVDFRGCGTQSEAVVSEPCNAELCSTWGGWSQVGSCSVTCGGSGTVTYQRQCSGVGTRGSELCYRRSGECGFEACPRSITSWAAWSEWSDCSGSCSPGVRSRTRRCENSGRVLDVRECINYFFKYIVPISSLASYYSQRQPCNGHMCTAWTTWGPYEPCARTCRISFNDEPQRVSRRECFTDSISQPQNVEERNAFTQCSSRFVACSLPFCSFVTAQTFTTLPVQPSTTLPFTPSRAILPVQPSTTLPFTPSRTILPVQPSTTFPFTPSRTILPVQPSTTFPFTPSRTILPVEPSTILFFTPPRTTPPTQPSTTPMFTTPRTFPTEPQTQPPSTPPPTEPQPSPLPQSTSAPSTTTSTTVPPISSRAESIWSPWSGWSRCSSSCGSGIQLRVRQCFDRSNNTLSGTARCEGPVVENAVCNANVCDSWGQWTSSDCIPDCQATTSVQSIFRSGTRQRTRNCLTPNMEKGSPACYIQSSSCLSDTLCPTATVAPTSPTTPATPAAPTNPSTPATPAAPTNPNTPAAPTSSTIPMTPAPSTTPTTPLTPAAPINPATRSCDNDPCNTWSQWASGECSAQCGESGTRVSKRRCLDDVNFNIPVLCYERSESCVAEPCDQDTDFLFLVDSSNKVDNCPQLLREGMSKPITPRFQTNETTPVYLKMKEFMKSVVTGWRSVADDKSRVGVQLFSEACSLTTDYNLNLVKRIGDSNNDTASYIESIDYLCGDPWLDWALRCTDRKVLTSSAGDRPGIPNVIVALVSAIPRSFRPTNFLLSRLSSNIKRKGSTIIAVTATPPSQMSALSRQKHEEMMRTLSCQRSSGHCPTYIGSIWDGGSPAQRIRDALKGAK